MPSDAPGLLWRFLKAGKGPRRPVRAGKPAYDAEGNRTARFIDNDVDGTLSTGDTDVTEYTWDTANRLTAITNRDDEGGLATQIVDYTYDLYNRRIAKNLDNDGDGAVDYSESYVLRTALWS